MKKTSPMKGEVFFTGDTHTYRHTDGHRDSMTESAQWANSVKKALVKGQIPKLEVGLRGGPYLPARIMRKTEEKI